MAHGSMAMPSALPMSKTGTSSPLARKRWQSRFTHRTTLGTGCDNGLFAQFVGVVRLVHSCAADRIHRADLLLSLSGSTGVYPRIGFGWVRRAVDNFASAAQPGERPGSDRSCPIDI